MEVSIEKQGIVTVIALNGRLDTTNYTLLEDKLLREISPGASVLVDCEKMDYISSSGLRILLLALKQSGQTGAHLALCSLQPGIVEIFKISAFDSIFSIYPDRQKALDELQNK